VSAPGAIPKVAVVIPCYGYAHYLPEAVGSVAGQTRPPAECVVVDDGSPDDTAEVANRLIGEHDDLDLRLVRQENAGLSAARNAGVRATSAPLLLPLDADDRLAPTALEELAAEFARDPELDVVCPYARSFGASTERVVTLPATGRRMLRGNIFVYCSMFTRRIFERVGGYNSNMRYGYEDWDFWLGAIEAGANLGHLPRELMLYRRHGRSMLDDADDRAVWLRARVVANHPDLFPAWRRRLAEDVLAAGEGRPGAWTRLRAVASLLLDRRLRLTLRHLRGGGGDG